MKSGIFSLLIASTLISASPLSVAHAMLNAGDTDTVITNIKNGKFAESDVKKLVKQGNLDKNIANYLVDNGTLTTSLADTYLQESYTNDKQNNIIPNIQGGGYDKDGAYALLDALTGEGRLDDDIAQAFHDAKLLDDATVAGYLAKSNAVAKEGGGYFGTGKGDTAPREGTKGGDLTQPSQTPREKFVKGKRGGVELDDKNSSDYWGYPLFQERIRKSNRGMEKEL